MVEADPGGAGGSSADDAQAEARCWLDCGYFARRVAVGETMPTQPGWRLVSGWCVCSAVSWLRWTDDKTQVGALWLGGLAHRREPRPTCHALSATLRPSSRPSRGDGWRRTGSVQGSVWRRGSGRWQLWAWPGALNPDETLRRWASSLPYSRPDDPIDISAIVQRSRARLAPRRAQQHGRGGETVRDTAARVSRC